jgi:hypothetical protein
MIRGGSEKPNGLIKLDANQKKNFFVNAKIVCLIAPISLKIKVSGTQIGSRY